MTVVTWQIGNEFIRIETTVEGLTNFLSNKDGQYAKWGDAVFPLCKNALEHSDLCDDGKSKFAKALLIFKLINSDALNKNEKKLVTEALESHNSDKAAKRPGRPKVDTNPLLTILVETCVAGGASRFRNEVSSPNSACDIVAEAFRRVGWSPTSYSGIKSLYLKSKKAKEIKRD